MPDLPTRPDMGQLRNQAKDLLRAANNGDRGRQQPHQKGVAPAHPLLRPTGVGPGLRFRQLAQVRGGGGTPPPTRQR